MYKLRPEDFEGSWVPEHTQGALMRYVNHGLHPGGFLTAVITNDLIGAVTRADQWNVQTLPAIVMFMLNAMPAASVGSTENMDHWIKLAQEEAAQSEEE
jgi:hypothetical protein